MKTVVYSAIGKDFVWESCISAKSLRDKMSGVKIILFSNCSVESDYFDEIYKVDLDSSIEPEIKSIKVKKIESLRNLPDGEFLFLDSDTFIVEPFWEIFSYLNYFDIGVCFDNWRMGERTPGIPSYNSGVVVFRSNDKTRLFFDKWREEYLTNESIPDQYTFNQLLVKSDLRYVTMPPEYNFRAEELHLAAGHVKIIHKHHRTSVRRNSASLGQFLNLTDEIRLYIPDGKMIRFDSNGVSNIDIEECGVDLSELRINAEKAMNISMKVSE